ncbi:MAG TPA: hypothetical protein VFR81_00945 [Longimicrobium sp.]|nr:hypothetical protein [Longimicrobium sp.]
MSKQWRATRNDGEDLGTFDSRDEAEEAVAADARHNGEPIHTWKVVFGAAHAMSRSHTYEVKVAE